MKLLQVFAETLADAWLRATKMDLTHANAEELARDMLTTVAPSGWLIDFPNGRVFIDNEALMLINHANGYQCTPVYAGEPL